MAWSFWSTFFLRPCASGNIFGWIGMSSPFASFLQLFGSWLFGSLVLELLSLGCSERNVFLFLLRDTCIYLFVSKLLSWWAATSSLPTITVVVAIAWPFIAIESSFIHLYSNLNRFHSCWVLLASSHHLDSNCRSLGPSYFVWCQWCPAFLKISEDLQYYGGTRSLLKSS